MSQITRWFPITGPVSQAVADPPGSTIVAVYKRIVVGVALIAPPPDEAYIPYVAVRVGWERCSIGLYVEQVRAMRRIIDSIAGIGPCCSTLLLPTRIVTSSYMCLPTILPWYVDGRYNDHRY